MYPDEEHSHYKINVVIILVVFLSLGVLITIPYRSFSTNGIYILGLSSIIVQLIFIQAIVKKVENALFIDRYYMYTSSVLNGFGWFLVLCIFVMLFILKTHWPVDKEFCYDIMDGSELSIFHVKEARRFQKELIHAKRLTPELAYKLERLLDDMGNDFNKIRG
jgi:hypothetical protein